MGEGMGMCACVKQMMYMSICLILVSHIALVWLSQLLTENASLAVGFGDMRYKQ